MELKTKLKKRLEVTIGTEEEERAKVRNLCVVKRTTFLPYFFSFKSLWCEQKILELPRKPGTQWRMWWC